MAQDAGTHTHAVIVVGDVSWPTAETQHASGAVHLYRSSTNGTWELLWRFGGEAERPGGLLGSTVATGVHSDGKSTLVFGGYLGNGLEGIDRGSLYSVKLGAW